MLLALAFLGAPVPGAARETLQVIVFPGGFNWPIWAAQERGFFARDGLEVKLTPTPSSVFQLTNLIEGKFDIGMTAIDNVIAYQEGQGEATVSATSDLFAFMGGDNGFLRLVVQPEITGYGELRGKELSVDALTTGYAFVLRKMLERGGLREGDYTLVRAESVLPLEVLAESAGLRRLGNAVDVLGHYQGLVGAARRSWAQTHQRELVGYIRAYRAGLAWLYDRANTSEALALLQKNVRGMTPELAAKTYDVLLGRGFEPEAALDVEGIRTVLALRSQYGRPQKELTDPARYYDLSYYERARR